MEGVDIQVTLTDQPQTKLVIEQCPLCLPPVLDVAHELVGCQQVTGPIEDSTIGYVGSQVTLQPLTAGKLTAELPGIDCRGAEGTVATLPHCLLHLSLDVLLQVIFNIMS